MTTALLVLALVLSLAVLGRGCTARRGPGTARDDSLRAGQEPPLSAAGATLRAGGLTAWMRLGGGSGA